MIAPESPSQFIVTIPHNPGSFKHGPWKASNGLGCGGVWVFRGDTSPMGRPMLAEMPS